MSERKKVNYRLVEVEWIDSASTPGWQAAPVTVPLPCWSAGYLIHRDRLSMVVALCCSSERSGNGFGDTITIPTGCVKSVRFLK